MFEQLYPQSTYRPWRYAAVRSSMLHRRGRRVRVTSLGIDRFTEGPAHDPYAGTKFWVRLSNGRSVCLRMGELSGTVLSQTRAPRRRHPKRMQASKPAYEEAAVLELHRRFEQLTGIPVDRFEKLYYQRFYFEDPMGHPSQYV